MTKYTRLLKNLGKPYMHGEDVREVQKYLIAFGYLADGQADGYFGKITDKAVRAYQKAKGLKVDGVVGSITWGAMFTVQPKPKPKTDTIQIKLAAHAGASEERGDIYVLGAQGQTGTAINEAWIRKREHYKSGNIKRVLKLWNARKDAGLNVWAFDCSGLIMYLLIKEGYADTDTNADGIFKYHCDGINRADLQAGDTVGKSGHIGVYMGDGTVVHAKGRDVGVVRESINAVKWTRYGRLK